jgi:hypothetical protein
LRFHRIQKNLSILIIYQKKKAMDVHAREILLKKANHFLGGFIYDEDWFITTFNTFVTANRILHDTRFKNAIRIVEGRRLYQIRVFAKAFVHYVGSSNFPRDISRIIIECCLIEDNRTKYYRTPLSIERKGIHSLFYYYYYYY